MLLSVLCSTNELFMNMDRDVVRTSVLLYRWMWTKNCVPILIQQFCNDYKILAFLLLPVLIFSSLKLNLVGIIIIRLASQCLHSSSNSLLISPSGR